MSSSFTKEFQAGHTSVTIVGCLAGSCGLGLLAAPDQDEDKPMEDSAACAAPVGTGAELLQLGAYYTLLPTKPCSVLVAPVSQSTGAWVCVTSCSKVLRPQP